MHEFEFRLRANFSSGNRIASDDEEVVLDKSPNGLLLRLRAGVRGTPIKENDRIVLVGGPFQTEHSARVAAEWAKAALLQWAVFSQIGVDIGDGHQRNRATEAGLAVYEAQLGVPVRNDVHGIDVYPVDGRTRFVHVDVALSLAKDLTGVRASIVTEWSKQRTLSAKQVTACEIFTTSFFDTNSRSRFVSLVTAIEALLEPDRRAKEAQLLVEQFKRMVGASGLPNETKESMKGTLNWLRDESISQTGRKLAGRLLAGRTYGGQPPDKFFRGCYETRSNIVHRGSAGSTLDMLKVANATQVFVSDLILASIESDASPPISARSMSRPTHQEIAAAAYSLWQARSSVQATDPTLMDWLEAERILTSE